MICSYVATCNSNIFASSSRAPTGPPSAAGLPTEPGAIWNSSPVDTRACRQKFATAAWRLGKKTSSSRCSQAKRGFQPEFEQAPPLALVLFSKLSGVAKKNNPATDFFRKTRALHHPVCRRCGEAPDGGLPAAGLPSSVTGNALALKS